MKYLFSALVILTLISCKDGGDQTILQYMPDMADTPVAKAQQTYLNPPEHSVAYNSPIYPKTLEEAEKYLRFPQKLTQDRALQAKGKELFNNFCAVCHGMDAKGKNKLGVEFPPPPDITADYYKSKAPGFFFYKMTFGGPVMPALGYATSAIERWQIFYYLRNTLQNSK